MSRRRNPALFVVGAALVADLLMIATDMGPNLVATTVLGVLVGATIWFMAEVGPTAARPRPAAAGPGRSSQSADLRITTLRQALAYGGSDHYLAERVHSTLVDVVDDELRATHGVDRAHDPTAAADILGPELTRFVDDPESATRMTAPGLTRIVTLIEQI